ncbi:MULTISPECIES: hypothetical protein [Kitasatospora]|uniref:Uncharacterized protein n=1 Tax=Kitasatospora cystarginea TaxID=58350 RepID=A0ABN3DTP4_9ACTN
MGSAGAAVPQRRRWHDLYGGLQKTGFDLRTPGREGEADVEDVAKA